MTPEQFHAAVSGWRRHWVTREKWDLVRACDRWLRRIEKQVAKHKATRLGPPEPSQGP